MLFGGAGVTGVAEGLNAWANRLVEGVLGWSGGAGLLGMEGHWQIVWDEGKVIGLG